MMVQVSDSGEPETAAPCYDHHCELLEPVLGRAASGEGRCWNDDKTRRRATVANSGFEARRRPVELWRVTCGGQGYARGERTWGCPPFFSLRQCREDDDSRESVKSNS